MTLALFFSIFALSSNAEEVSENSSRIFGVAKDDPSQIQLKLNDDMSFKYQDLSSSKSPIKVSGVYQIKANRVILLTENIELKFHDHWRIQKEGNRAHSRKALCFYSLSLQTE